MTLAHPHGRPSAINAKTAGWMTSFCIHAALALGTAFFLQQVQLAPQPKPFQWDVAMVEPVARPASEASTSTVPPTPPEPTRTATTPPLQRTPPPPQPAPTEMPLESSHVDVAPRPMTVPVAPVQPPSAPVQAAQPTRQEPVPQPPPQAAAPTILESAPEPAREHLPIPPKTTMKSEDLPKPAPPTEAPPPASLSGPHTPEQLPAPIEPRKAPLSPPPAPTVTAPPQPTMEAATQQPPAPIDPTPLHEIPSSQPAPASPVQQLAALAPPAQAKAAKPDDGWLADLMGKWILDLEKHYPASLRTEGIQGKVVIVAMLHDNGTLSDVRVAKSSGHALLDQAAVSDVENGPPIHLSQPLGRPQRPIKFSISYDLKTSR